MSLSAAEINVPDKHISLECIIKRRTEKAILIGLDYEIEPEDSVKPVTETWIPLSQIHSIHGYQQDGDVCFVVMTDWIAGKKGL